MTSVPRSSLVRCEHRQRRAGGVAPPQAAPAMALRGPAFAPLRPAPAAPRLWSHRVSALATGTGEDTDTAMNGPSTPPGMEFSGATVYNQVSSEPHTERSGAVPRVVGVGAKGCSALGALVRSGIVAGASCYAMAVDAATASKVPGAEPLVVSAAPADVQAETKATVLAATTGDDPPPLFVVAAAAGDGGGRMAASVAAASRDAGLLTTAALMLPFSFEGTRKAAEAAEVVDEAGRAADLLLVIDQNALLAQPGMTVDQASTIASSALLRGVRAVCAAAEARTALIASRWTAGLGASQVRRVLRSGERISVGHGGAEVTGGREPRAAAKAAQAAAQSTFLAGLAQSEGVLACVTGSAGALQANCEAAERALRKVAPADASVMVVGVPPAPGGVAEAVEVTLLALQDVAAVRPPTPPPTTDAEVEVVAEDEGDGEDGGAVATEDGSAPPGASARWRMAAALAGGAPSVDRSGGAPDLETVDWADDYDPALDGEDGGGAWDEEDDGEDGGGDGDGILPGRLRRLWRRGPGPKTARERTSGVLASDRSAREGDETARPIVEMSYPDGATYEGQWGAGKPEGKGRRVEANGSWYEGYWADGRKHGWGVSLTWGDRYEGEWADGLQEGRGTLVYQCGDRLEGTFVAGQAEGPGVITYAADGSVFYGTFRRGAMHGRGLLVEAAGSRDGESEAPARWEEVWAEGKRVSVRRLEEGEEV